MPTNNREVRMVMVGKTGTGKSASRNTILGRDCFQSRCSPKSLTEVCTKGWTEVEGQKVVVIDTPGLLDTRFDEKKTTRDLSQCINYAAPGPHVFLVVISLTRFTKEEKKSVKRIQEVFGAAADRYSMVLFTHGDDLEGTTIKRFLSKSPELQELVGRCNGQFHVFNNKLKDKKPQVLQLLKKIKHIVQKNGGSHYTNQMFQEAERKIEEEKQRILKEKEEKIRREREELEKRMQEAHQRNLQRIYEQRERERRLEMKEMRWEMEDMRWREKERIIEEERREEEEREREMKEMRMKMKEMRMKMKEMRWEMEQMRTRERIIEEERREREEREREMRKKKQLKKQKRLRAQNKHSSSSDCSIL